jgi:hypothetical protein
VQQRKDVTDKLFDIRRRFKAGANRGSEADDSAFKRSSSTFPRTPSSASAVMEEYNTREGCSEAQGDAGDQRRVHAEVWRLEKYLKRVRISGYHSHKPSRRDIPHPRRSEPAAARGEVGSKDARYIEHYFLVFIFLFRFHRL